MACGGNGAGQVDGLNDRFGGQRGGDVGQWDVDGHQDAGQGITGEHHGVTVGAGSVGQHFGVAGIGDTGGPPGFLLNRSGDDGIDGSN